MDSKKFVYKVEDKALVLVLDKEAKAGRTPADAMASKNGLVMDVALVLLGAAVAVPFGETKAGNMYIPDVVNTG